MGTFDKNRYSVTVFVTNAVALIIHSGLFVLFWQLQIPFMMWFNLASLVVYTITLVSVLCFQYSRFALVVSFCEVILHQIFAVYFLGLQSGFQFFLIFPIIIPFLVSRKQDVLITVYSLCSVVVLVALDAYMSARQPAYVCNPQILFAMRVCNIFSTGVLLFIISIVFTRMVTSAEEKAARLMDNILPPVISRRLQENPQSITSKHNAVSVLFLDIAGFTRMSEEIGNERLVHLLNELFSRFDSFIDEYHIEKIKTIGDSYMVACGLPEAQKQHCEYTARFALRLLDEVAIFNKKHHIELRVRIGIATGSVVAGVIGKRKFIYDLWGSTVNTASRMESTGVPGKIQVTSAVQQKLQNSFCFTERGFLDIKGIGSCQCWFLDGEKTQ